MCYIHTSNTIQSLVYPYPMATIGIEVVLYISAWGLCVARFDKQGNILGASNREASDSAGLHAFLCLEVQSFLINLRVAEVLNPTKL